MVNRLLACKWSTTQKGKNLRALEVQIFSRNCVIAKQNEWLLDEITVSRLDCPLMKNCGKRYKGLTLKIKSLIELFRARPRVGERWRISKITKIKKLREKASLENTN